MKKVLSLVAVAGVIAAGTVAFGATIVGSKHDLSPTGGTSLSKGTSTQICVYCHAPHDALLSLPLWNRSNPAAGGFVLYSGLNMANVSFKTGFTKDSTSLFCMSCHDGVTEMDAIHNAGVIETDGTTSTTGGRGATDDTTFTYGAITSKANLTTDLSKTHPINFPVSLSDTQSDLNVGSDSKMGPYADASGLQLLTPAIPKVEFPLFKTTNNDASMTGRATDRSLECGSCHAVHDSQYSPFLRATMDKSALCLGCHNK